MTVCPCWRISTPVDVSESSTTIRPSPPRPRRKLTSFSVCWRSNLPSAKRAAPVAACCAPPVAAKVIKRLLPSILASYGTMFRRLSTRRVRSPACTTFIERNTPSPISWLLRPKPLVVSGKSNAIRAGLAIVKLPGGASIGFFRVRRISTWPPLCVTSKFSMLFCCAEATDTSRSNPDGQIAARIKLRTRTWFIISLLRLPATARCSDVRSSRPPHPG